MIKINKKNNNNNNIIIIIMNTPQPPRIIRQTGFNRTFPLIEEDTDDDKENTNPNTVRTTSGLKRNNKRKIKSQKQLIAGRVRTIHTGPRGGKYYIKSKKKVYI